MQSFVAWLLGTQLGVLLAHRMGRRWGALPAGLLLGCLVAGGATINTWQVLESPPGAAMLELLANVMWANAFFALLLAYVHDGSPRVRSLFLGCVLVLGASFFAHHALMVGGAMADRGFLPLARCYFLQILMLACVLVTACIAYQSLANRLPSWPRWLRFYIALSAASCLGVVVLSSLNFGGRPTLHLATSRSMADYVIACALLVPMGEIYLRFFSLLRVLPEPRRHLLDLVRWMPGYRAREHTEDRHRNLLRALPDLAFVVAQTGECVDALSADDAGHTPPPSSMRSRLLSDIFPADTAARLLESARIAIATGRTQEVAYTFGEDHPRTFVARIAGCHEPLARENRAIVTVRDETDVHRKLQDAQTQGDALHNAPAAVFVMNPSGRVLFAAGADTAALALLQAQPDPEPTEQQAALDDARTQCLATGEASRWIAVSHNGVKRRFALLLRLCAESPGQSARIVGMLADLSRPASQWAETFSRERLESLGRLAAGAAHDINNLLVGIMGHASLAVRNISPVSRARLNVEQLLKAAEKATAFTRKLLAYSGRDQPRLKTVDVNDLVRDARPSFERLLPPECRLRIQTGSDLPLILGDAAQIQDVLRALVENAAHASAPNGGTIRLRTGAGQEDPLPPDSLYFGERVPDANLVWIEIADEGEGIPQDTLRLIFDPFFTTRPNRRGLGLALALGTMRSLKGGIAAASVPDAGSRFRLCFSAHHQPPAPSSMETPPEFKGSGIALVVDDEEAVRVVAEQILEQLGFRVLTAADGKQGIDTAVENIARLSLVLLDLTMPVMGGEETFTSLRMLKPDLRIILSSGYSEPEALRELFEDPFVSFLQKPYTVEALSETVARIFTPPTSKPPS